MSTWWRVVAIAMAALMGVAPSAGAAGGLPGDAEAATHGDEAATLQVVKETVESQPDFVFRQYNLAVLSHYSYLIGSGGEAIVVDPARDISRYLKDAAELKLKIKYVYLTHSHADFVAGHMELRKATGAEVVMNEDAGALFPHRRVREGDEIRVGSVRGIVMATPGHTPDGTCLCVFRPADAPAPAFVCTGDTLFIGSVGRPDLMGEGMSAATLARQAFRSWTDKLAKLPDATRIFPAHGAGSLCGAHLSDKPVSTIGEQRRENPYLQHAGVNSFVMAMIDGLPAAPQYFAHNAKMNHDGPPLVDWSESLPRPLKPTVVSELPDMGAWIIDLRDSVAFAAGHPKDAINIGIRGRFETWTGMMIPWGEPIVLAGSDDEVKEARFRLHRIGYDRLAGYLEGGVDAWKKEKLRMPTLTLLQPADLYARMRAGTAPVIVDVRLPTEWMGLRIGDVLNIPVNRLFIDGRRLDSSMPVLTVCNSAYRSSMGASVLQKMGFTNLFNLAGGSEAWIAAGLPTLSAPAAGGPAAPAGAAASGSRVNLPEGVGAPDLAQRLMDLPGTVEIVDIRPAWQFAEFSIPGSANVSVEQLLLSPVSPAPADARPLVIVSRDGYVAAAAGGVLSQRSGRSIRYLVGGAQQYYDQVMRPAGIMSEKSPLPAVSPPPAAPKPGAPAAAPPPAAPPSPPAASPPVAAPKKSAGC